MVKIFFAVLVLVFVVQGDAYARVMIIPPTDDPVEVEQKSADVAAPVQALIAAPDGGVAPAEDPSAPMMKMAEPMLPELVGEVAPVSATQTGMSSSLLRALLIFSILILGLLLFFKFRKKKN